MYWWRISTSVWLSSSTVACLWWIAASSSSWSSPTVRLWAAAHCYCYACMWSCTLTPLLDYWKTSSLLLLTEFDSVCVLCINLAVLHGSVYVWCICWVDSRSHWALLQRCHSRHHWPAAAQAWLHAHRLFTRTFHSTQLACESATDSVGSAEPNTEHRQFHVTELSDWPCRPHHWTHRRLPCAALPCRHRTLRPCHDAAVSCFWIPCTVVKPDNRSLPPYSKFSLICL